MKLNKKGFTLIELLAVVVILLAISTIAISSISAAIERNKKKQDNAKLEVIYNYARLYYQSHRNTLTGVYGDNRACIELDDLTNLTEEEKKYTSGDEIIGVVLMKNGNYFLDENNSECDFWKNATADKWENFNG